MANKWKPVAELLAHIAADDDLMLQWGLQRHGDVRGKEPRQALVNMQREELIRLIRAVQQRANR